MSSSSKKIKTVRLHHDTWSRLNKYRGEDESFNKLVNRILDENDIYKGKKPIEKPAVHKSPHETIEELNGLQQDLVNAINGLRKTYESNSEWQEDFGKFVLTFGDALKFRWAKAQIQQSQRLKTNPKLMKLRLKWIEQILNIVWQIERIT